MSVSDFANQIQELSDRVTWLEQRAHMTYPESSFDDWDNATLMLSWKISQRTTANYRKQGLGFYKRGGRIFYPPESREKFIKERSSL